MAFKFSLWDWARTRAYKPEKTPIYLVSFLTSLIFLALFSETAIGAPKQTTPSRTAACTVLKGQPRRLITPKEPALIVPSSLINVRGPSFEFAGLSSAGLAKLRELRDTHRARAAIYQERFRKLEGAFHVGTLARAMKQHVFLQGPPGGAKSDFVEFFKEGEGEEDPIFQLPMHQMVTENMFIGGQTEESLRAGTYVHNVANSIVQAKVAHLDEVDKGNPLIFALLLNLLNERVVRTGRGNFPAALETMFATSNHDLYGFLEAFRNNGAASTGPALLNRFLFKCLFSNWLPPEDQAYLDERVRLKTYLQALADDGHQEVLKNKVFLKAPVFDWVSFRKIAYTLFQLDEVAQGTLRSLANDFEPAVKDQIIASENVRRNNPHEPLYEPSADPTERWRQLLERTVIMSSAIAFLSSPLADDSSIEYWVNAPIQLDALSLWRIAYAMTTITMGSPRMIIDPQDAANVDIRFSAQLQDGSEWSLASIKPRNKTEEFTHRDILLGQQQHFIPIFKNRIREVASNIQIAAGYNPTPGRTRSATPTLGSFEARLNPPVRQ